MKALDIKNHILPYISPYLGVYPKLNIPSIYIGNPPAQTIANGVEVIISDLPVAYRPVARVATTRWEITINNFSIEKIKFNKTIEALQMCLAAYNPSFVYVPKPGTISTNDLDIVESMRVLLNTAELLINKPVKF